MWVVSQCKEWFFFLPSLHGLQEPSVELLWEHTIPHTASSASYVCTFLWVVDMHCQPFFGNAFLSLVYNDGAILDVMD